MPIEWPSWIPMPGLTIPLAIVWDTVWRGIALWRAGRSARLAWFIALLIFNTVGILPIIYIFAVSKKIRLFPRKPDPPVSQDWFRKHLIYPKQKQ